MKHAFLRSSLLISMLLLTGGSLHAQVVGTVPSPYESIEQNSISNMEAIGDTLWIGPGLNRNIQNQPTWYFPEGADSTTTGRGRVFSLALSADTVLAGLGYNLQTPNGSVQTGIGYHTSTDGGDSWSFLQLPLDAEDDTTFIYGGHQYRILPIIVPQQSPPFDIDLKGSTIFTANWASGILRSVDFGQNWQRLILPPQPADSLVPEETYTFTSSDTLNRYDPRSDQNLLGFSAHVDPKGILWTGTAGGLNISPNALTASRDSIRWNHLTVDNSGLLGNWIIGIDQQSSTGDIWLTNWNAGISASEQFGIQRTSDGGETFESYLAGQRINDIGFSGNYIFAVGDNGLFISSDNGQNWQQIEQIQSPDSFIKASARYFSVATTSERVWISTSDGLASTARENPGQTWEITRVNFPLSGGNRYQQNAPDVEAYAYPNPFSPQRQGIVRIKFNVENQGNVKIRLYDFGMNLVRELENGSFPQGTYEAVWDGTDHNGNVVANGPVFYQIETTGNVARGKILVID
ncbi:MAG: FlgD immunoglobulin-like domain containing protein [Balneolaceae bacterium]|nr:FlgD immunoglobulin-like domain containing protein [Balneolaceae bacterium]